MAAKPKFVCGDYDDREVASHSHYSWHRRQGQEPCDKARAEHAWYMAEWKAKKPLPDWKPSKERPKPVNHICGNAEDAERPSGAAYEWHQRQGTAPCDKSKAERYWKASERRAGHPLPDYKYRPKKTAYVCGTADDREEPNTGHAAGITRNELKPARKPLRKKTGDKRRKTQATRSLTGNLKNLFGMNAVRKKTQKNPPANISTGTTREGRNLAGKPKPRQTGKEDCGCGLNANPVRSRSAL